MRRELTPGRAAGDLAHQLVHVLELPERRPVGVALPPVRVGRQPDREGLGEVLVGMALRVPGVEVEDEAPAVRPRRVVLRIGLEVAAEELLAPPPPAQAVRVVDRVAGLVAQDAHAPLRGAALDLEHLVQLEAREPRVREVERNRDARHAVGREPLVGEPEVRPEDGAPRGELARELGDALLELGALDVQIEIAEAQVEQSLVLGIPPGRGRQGGRAAWRGTRAFSVPLSLRRLASTLRG